MKVIHIITGLNADGAETMMENLIVNMDPRFENEVISLTTQGAIGPRLTQAGIKVRALGLNKNPFSILKSIRLGQWLHASRPAVVQTWMYHADLIGGVAAYITNVAPVIWGVHHANLNADCNKRSLLLIARICAWLSKRIPATIVCCSNAGRDAHVDFGYAREITVVIPNGFDTKRFRFCSSARTSIRKELGVTPDTPLVGMAGRYHENKDHSNFIRAAQELHKTLPEVHFVLLGRDITWQNKSLAHYVRDAGLENCIHLLGERRDIPELFSAMDVVTSSSVTEALPLAIGEAMACCAPCVVTDVGDSGLLVMDTGLVVPPKTPSALAEAWRTFLERGAEARERAGTAGRRRIEKLFSLSSVAARYERLYSTLAANQTH
jgi:glycosyltransferase involved in cell wall biosynthesis